MKLFVFSHVSRGSCVALLILLVVLPVAAICVLVPATSTSAQGVNGADEHSASLGAGVNQVSANAVDDAPFAPAAGAASFSPANLQPQYGDSDFYGMMADPLDMLGDNISWQPQTQNDGPFSFEVRVRIDAVSAADSNAGIVFDWNGSDDHYMFQIFPGEQRWVLTYSLPLQVSLRQRYTGPQEVTSGPGAQWYTLKIVVDDNNRIHAFINGEEKTDAAGIPRQGSGGMAGLRIRDCQADFDDAAFSLNGQPVFSDGFSQPGPWQKQDGVTWSVVQDNGVQGAQAAQAGTDPGQAGAPLNDIYRGSVLLPVDQLLSPELSPRLDAHFRQMRDAGAHQARIMFSWDEAQPSGPDSYNWQYMDAAAIEAHKYGLQVLAVLNRTPTWALAPADRGKNASHAYPPVDNADYARFVQAAVARYMPGGALAREQGWTDGYGIIDYECGAEFNIRDFWNGTLAQFVPYLKAGYDAVHGQCAQCKVLNGAAADDVIPFYQTSNNEGIPIVNAQGVPQNNADGSPQVRQHVWQGVEDLYTAIRNSPVDNYPAHYFDILNVHSYQWRGLSAGGWAPDAGGSYDFYSADGWRKWYDDRVSNITATMRDPALFAQGVPDDSGKDIWVTETGYASFDNGDGFRGYLGSEQLQADALRTAYAEVSRFPQVKRLFWWYAWDTDTNTGLVRKDMSLKPAYEAYSGLTGAIPSAPPIDYVFGTGTAIQSVHVVNNGAGYARVELYRIAPGAPAGTDPPAWGVQRLTGNDSLAPGAAADMPAPPGPGQIVVRSQNGQLLLAAARAEAGSGVAAQKPLGDPWQLPRTVIAAFSRQARR